MTLIYGKLGLMTNWARIVSEKFRWLTVMVVTNNDGTHLSVAGQTFIGNVPYSLERVLNHDRDVREFVSDLEYALDIASKGQQCQ